MLLEPLEGFLISLDRGIWSAIFRLAIGFAIPPVFRGVLGSRASLWTYLAMFVAVLVGLRVVPAIMRRVLPFSAEAKAVWAERRALAKRYDSYQWRKLLWLGLGMLPHLFLAQGIIMHEFVLIGFCLLAGAAGEIVWHRSSAGSVPQRRLATGTPQRQ
jgi:hypothetical protein